MWAAPAPRTGLPRISAISASVRPSTSATDICESPINFVSANEPRSVPHDGGIRLDADQWSGRPGSLDKSLRTGKLIEEVIFMSRIDLSPIPLAIGMMVALMAGSASAQSINLTGVYRCVQVCRGDLPAHITQNGPELNLLTESGAASRAWPDWFSPANRIWVDAFNESAVFSPDGMLIQFDNGTIWHRELPPLRRRY